MAARRAMGKCIAARRSGRIQSQDQSRIVVNNAIAADVVEAMRTAANTGNGKIFVIDVEDAVRIRTNEREEAAV